MNIVVYTAIFGGHDVLWSVPPTETDARHVCFTDAKLVEHGCWGWKDNKAAVVDEGPTGLRAWEVVKVDGALGPRKMARMFKAVPHRHVSADVWIWVDGNVRLLVSPEEVVRRWLKRDVATFKHPDRGCLYDEAAFCAKVGKDSKKTLDRQTERYRADGMPARWGLPETRVVVRRDTEAVRRMGEAWWKEMREGGSIRDQVSLPYVCWKQGITWDHLPGRCWPRNDSEYFWYRKHAKGGKR